MKIRSTVSSATLIAIFVLLAIQNDLSSTTGVSGHPSSPSSYGYPNFASIHVLPDGEMDRRVHRDGVTGRETFDSVGLRLVQITDGRRLLLQAVYDPNGELKDCEFVRDSKSVVDFLAQLEDDFAVADRLRSEDAVESDDGDNVTVRLLRRGDLAKSPELKRLVEYKTIRDQCQTLHIKMKEWAQQAQDDEAGTSDETSVRRRKRELFIYPGTNWCGAGTTSNGFSELGFYAAADRCCRQHDHCAKTIPGFATKYNLFNYRFHTVSDCECDERFRTCLKMLNNEHSNLVGKIFFNVMQMKCLKIKNEKVCQKTSWWGRCLKHGRKQTAQLKDPLPY